MACALVVCPCGVWVICVLGHCKASPIFALTYCMMVWRCFLFLFFVFLMFIFVPAVHHYGMCSLFLHCISQTRTIRCLHSASVFCTHYTLLDEWHFCMALICLRLSDAFVHRFALRLLFQHSIIRWIPFLHSSLGCLPFLHRIIGGSFDFFMEASHVGNASL